MDGYDDIMKLAKKYGMEHIIKPREENIEVRGAQHESEIRYHRAKISTLREEVDELSRLVKVWYLNFPPQTGRK